jgi:hypothetical protein
MTDTVSEKGTPRLPATSKELAVYRKAGAPKSEVDRIDSTLQKSWGKNQKLHAQMAARLNGHTIEGTKLYDKAAGAMYLREILISEGEPDLADLPLARLSNIIGTVLRRYDFSPLELK